MEAMSLLDAILNPDSDFRKKMNESWRDYVISKAESPENKGAAPVDQSGAVSPDR